MKKRELEIAEKEMKLLSLLLDCPERIESLIDRGDKMIATIDKRLKKEV